MTEHYDYDLTPHNTFGIKARCRRYVAFDTVAEAQKALPKLVSANERLLILGGGSNLLLTGDFDGMVIHSHIMGMEQHDDGEEHVLLRCGSGLVWDEVVAQCVADGLYGAENLSLIPGEVGASAVQNIGAYGAEVKDLITTVEAVEIGTGRIVHFTNAQCEYAYRQSRFKRDWKNRFFITHVTYRLCRTFVPHLDYGNIKAALAEKGIVMPTAIELRQAIIDIRKAKLPDPKVEGNAGSFFMNPIVQRSKFEALLALYPDMPHYIIDADRVKIPAGWMIEQCGWKGKALGRAGVHHKQALVLVNKGGAEGSDVLALCRRIQADVKAKFGIDIYPEVNIQ